MSRFLYLIVSVQTYALGQGQQQMNPTSNKWASHTRPSERAESISAFVYLRNWGMAGRTMSSTNPVAISVLAQSVAQMDKAVEFSFQVLRRKVQMSAPSPTLY